MGLIDEEIWKLFDVDLCSYLWNDVNYEWEDLWMVIYVVMIDCMDYNIGCIFEVFEEESKFDNMFVIFFFDNGGCVEELGGCDILVIFGFKEFYMVVGFVWGWV